MNYYTTIEREKVEYDIRVNYKYYPARRGMFDYLNGRKNCGAQLTPDEPSQIEILSCLNTLTKSEIELTNREEESIIEQILEEKENEGGDDETDDF